MARVFRNNPPPVPASPAGYSWLIERYDLAVPPPPKPAGIGESHRQVESAEWLILPPPYRPNESLDAQITFALKYEGIDLSVLSALVKRIPESDLVRTIQTSPTGKYMRRFWFLAEWIDGGRLDLPDSSSKRGLERLVDSKLQLGLAHGETSERHRIINTLPGTPAFCPMVRCTPEINRLAERGLQNEARAVVGQTHPDVLARAAAFLLLSDSKASFAIEKETPSPDRARRWANTIARAGSHALTLESLLELQRALIGDPRFVNLGLRTQGGFIGSRDRFSNAPIPEHISARPEDVLRLTKGVVEYSRRTLEFGMDPIAAAAAVSFGFVYIHPFEDGNGRLHRWLIHHILAASGFSPENLVFPISAVMLRWIHRYRRVLESYSRPLLDFIDWQPTPQGNVKVTNETHAWYGFFDATTHAEFLYNCVEETITHDLPSEVAYLTAFDEFSAGVQMLVDMPADTVEQLHRFLRQNDGRLSARAKNREFSALSPEEVDHVEDLFERTTGSLDG